MKDRLRHYITHELLSDYNGASEPVRLGDDDDLLGSGLVDSIGMMALVRFIEDEADVDVPPEDVTIEHFLSLNAIDAYLQQRQGQL